MTMLKSIIVIAVLINCSLTRDINRQLSADEFKSKGGRRQFAANDGSTRLRSAHNLLKDPSLESFKFIHPLASAGVNSKPPPSRNIAALRFQSATKTTKKLFKIKLVLPKVARSKSRKLRGNVLFPDNISSINGECTWNLQKSNGRKILFVPKACVKVIASMAVTSLQKHKVLGLLIPKKNKQFWSKKRKITKSLVIAIYGKRMEVLLRKLAMKKQSTRLIVSMKKHDRKQK